MLCPNLVVWQLLPPPGLESCQGLAPAVPWQIAVAPPFHVWAAVAHFLVSEKEPYMALAVLLSFSAYLRASEMLSIRRAHLIPPAGGVTRH